MSRAAGPLAALLGLLLGAAAPAAPPRWGGLGAVAVSPDGKLVAAGGQNRVVYSLDPATLAVRQRVWLGSRVGALAFNKDGSRLLVEDDADALRILDTKSWKSVARVAGCARMAVAPAADLAAVRDPLHTPGALIRYLSATDGRERGRLELKERVAGFTLAEDGKSLVVLTEARSGDEKRVPPREVPATLTGLARRKFILEHDGLVADLRVYEVATGKLIRQATLWYTSDPESSRLIRAGDTASIVNFRNDCARIGPAGAATLFESGLLFNYGVGASPDGKVLVCGGLDEGTHGPPEGKRVRFALEPLPGAAEYFAAFAVRPDGSAYGVTSAFRAVRLGREGKVEKVAPVF